MRIALPLAAMFLIACGGKKSAAPAAEAKVPLTVKMPDDDGARAFARTLIAKEWVGINPTGSTDFSMAMTFGGDGTWTGKGHAELGGEDLDCVENGVWKIDGMEGPRAVMDWTIEKTNCPNREDGASQRVTMSIDGADYELKFR